MHALILGTRGIPSKHSGFETFAQDLSLFLRDRGHDVTVYCQAERKEQFHEDMWQGIRRIHIPAGEGPLGTIFFDWGAVRHSIHENGVVLTLGYNTGVFNAWYRLRRMPNLMNMDGIEWKRAKWSFPARAWFWFNEWAGARVANHLIADHPEIKKHLERHTSSRKITIIPYGAYPVYSAPVGLIEPYGLEPGGYYLLIARPEPENSILEIVQAFSRRKNRTPLVVLGKYSRTATTSFQRKVLDAAGEEVRFLGAIFDRDIVRTLRFYARAYVHGHRVGGTNPSLVESLAAGNAVIAHDNRFNRWVAGPAARYFRGADDLGAILDELDANPDQLQAMGEASRSRYGETFKQEQVLTAYEEVLLAFTSRHRCHASVTV